MIWSPRFDWWIIAVPGAAGLVAATAFILRSETIRRKWLRLPVWLLRLAALALLLLILANPVEKNVARTAGHDALNVLLVDTSESMGLERPSRLERALEWTRAVTAAASAGQTCRVVGFGDDVDFSGKPVLAGASTRLARALRRVLESNPDARLANILVLSDGRIHDRAELPAALALATQRRVAISTHLVGGNVDPLNVFIRTCDVGRSAPAGSRVPVAVEIGATGLPDGTNLDLTLKDETGKALATAPVTLRDGAAEATLTFEAGLRAAPYTVSVSHLDGELTYADNDFTFTLEVADPKVRVLYCEGSNDRITEMYGEFWNSSELFPIAWQRAGDIEADEFVTREQLAEGRTLAYVRGFRPDHTIVFDRARALPATREEWFSYDVIISSDVQRANYSADQLQWTVDLVAERGGGFCMIGGMTSFDAGKWDKTIWDKLVPVDMQAFGFGHKWMRTHFIFPESALAHPILRLDPDPAKSRRILEVHPDFLGMHDIRRAKPGATVLATRQGSTAPVVVTETYGKGHTMAFLSDPTGGWGQEHQGRWGPALLGEPVGPPHGDDPTAARPNEYYNRFWVNVVRWLAENSIRRQHKNLLGRSEAITCRPGETVKVAATLPGVLDPAEVAQREVGARLAIEGQPRTALRYDRDRKEFVGQLTLPENLEGTEVSVLFDSPGGDHPFGDEIRLRVIRLDREMENPRPDPQLMADLAHAGGGAVLDTPGEAIAFLQKNRRAAAQEIQPYTEPLWDRVWVWAVLAGIFAAEWTLRRLVAD